MKAIVLQGQWAPKPELRLSPEHQAQKKAPGSLAWKDPRYRAQTIDDPSPGHGEVVVRVRRVGVCGSDTHCYETDDEGYVLFSGPMVLPVVPGHEYAGEVVALGPGVRNLRIGQLVAAEGMLNCGVCEACRSFKPNQCPTLEMVGFSAPGAYAEYITVAERFCWSLDGLAESTGSKEQALELGALIEPISCPYNGIWVAGRGMLPGEHVVVYGCGPIGLGAIALCRAAGAASILAVDLSAERLLLATALGADQVVDPRTLAPGELSALIRTRTRGWGADLQVEAAGAAGVLMPEIETSFAPGGQMVYLGRTGERAPVMLDALVTGAASINGARGHVGGGCFSKVIRLLEHGRLPVEAMITAHMEFADFAQAIEQSCTRSDGKIMIRV